MKAQIESTTAIVDITDPFGGRAKARVWEGLTENGVAFTAYITTVQVHKRDDNSQFERELAEHKAPRPDTQRAIDLRFVI